MDSARSSLSWSRSRARWLVPAGAATAVAVGALAPSLAGAAGHPNLPPISVEKLLAAAQSPTVDAFSGTITETANLGLPQLPGTAGGTSATTLSLLAGSHTVRVSVDGADRHRVALLGQTSEQDVIHNGNDVWTYVSDGNKVTHYAVPADQAKAQADPAGKADPADTPAEETPTALADELLKAVDPSTAVTLGNPVTVAGRPAYTLTLTPRTAATLIGSARIAIDAVTHLPLRVQLFSRAGGKPALQVGFSKLSLKRPAGSTFQAPTGTTVSQGDLPGGPATAPGQGDTSGSSAKPTTVGDGWASIAILPAGSADGVLGANGGSGHSAHLRSRQLDAVTTTVAGGRGVQTALVSVLFATDGRVLVGAVPLSALSAAAS